MIDNFINDLNAGKVKVQKEKTGRIESSQLLLARKMDLESKWNQSYLENGRVTNAMQETSQEIKVIVKELISRDMLEARKSVNVLDYEVHAFAG